MTDVAAFDFDGTLTDGGSVLEFLVSLRGRRAVLLATAGLAPRLAHGALVGGGAADQAKQRLFVRTLAGVPLAAVEEASDRFARHHLARHLRRHVQDRFDWHRRRGDRVVIVSASPEVYVRVAGDLLGADGVVATRLAVDDRGALTGHYQGANCRGEEKLRRLREWIGDRGPDAGRLWAYGNSRGDLRMLHAADVGFNVGRLGRFGRLHSFAGLGAAPPG
ncbi:MAG TPA: HAD-IB family hydrolase [Acidimicrobiales bacterium]|nr:HAD-IB family hydrolase [Acidimicrobiales bacterium]